MLGRLGVAGIGGGAKLLGLEDCVEVWLGRDGETF